MEYVGYMLFCLFLQKDLADELLLPVRKNSVFINGYFLLNAAKYI